MHPTGPPPPPPPPPPRPLAPAAPLDHRVKQTFACEPCRRRKAKCSGVSPCPPCQKNGLDCVFVYQRQRRGRKAKGTTLGPAPLALPLPSKPDAARPSPSPTSSESGFSPCPPQFHQALLDDLALRTTSDPELDTSLLVTLVPHLLDLFFDRVAPQFPLFIQRSCLQRYINQGEGPIYLCYALSVVSLQWSAHRCIQDAPVRSRVEQLLVRYVRNSQQDQLQIGQLLPCLQSYCALIVHEACQGCGINVWADLGAATGMAELLNLQENISDATKVSMQLVKEFLFTFRSLSTVGHPELLGLSSRVRGVALDETTDAHPIPNISNLSSVCALLSRIHAEAALGFVDSTPPPWSSNSAFISLRQSLDRIRLSWPDCLTSHGQYPSQPTLEYSHPAHELLAVLMWHTCVILLNNVFLPIPVSSPECTLGFPRAPPQFLQERIQTCEASAAQVARICRRIMSQDVLFPSPLLGYSCIQAALVFLNQMQRSRPAISPELVLHLKVVLTMLGAIRNFYRPASFWIRTFMEIHGGLHQCDDAISAAIARPTTLFKNFAARFPGVGNIAFIPFAAKEQLEPILIATLAPPTLPDRPTATAHEENSREDWITAYDNHLDNDLACELAEHLQPRGFDDIDANYDNSLELMSDWHPADDFPFTHDANFPNDNTLQSLMDEIATTFSLSDTLLNDTLDQGAELLVL